MDDLHSWKDKLFLEERIRLGNRIEMEKRKESKEKERESG